MIDIIKSLHYIIAAPFFWLTMGSIVSISMFIGAMIFNGDRSAAIKSLFSVLVYAGFLLFVQIGRVNQAIHFTDKDEVYKAYAGTLTLIIVTFFWVVGATMGVFVSRHITHPHDRTIIHCG